MVFHVREKYNAPFLSGDTVDFKKERKKEKEKKKTEEKKRRRKKVVVEEEEEDWDTQPTYL